MNTPVTHEILTEVIVKSIGGSTNQEIVEALKLTEEQVERALNGEFDYVVPKSLTRLQRRSRG